VVANGVLNAPDYTRTCSCSYQNQTSLALVHMPEVETWTVSPLARPDAPRQPIADLGINFGAPGHQRDDQGTLWIEWPAVVTENSPAHIRANPEATPYRRHSSAYTDSRSPWIYASGLQNIQWLEIETSIGGGKAAAQKAPRGKSEDCQPDEPKTDATHWNLQLYFADPHSRLAVIAAAARSFDVLLKGTIVLQNIEIQPGGTLLKEINTSTPDDGPIRLEFRARSGQPVISGIRLQRINP